MSLIECKECKKEVSKKADTCPHCGVKNPGINKREVVGGFIVLAIIAIGIASCSGGEEKENKSPGDIAKEASCKKDMKCWAEKNTVMASVTCAPQIEKLAKYDFEWTGSSYSPRLSRFKWKDMEKGTLSYFGDAIKFQNGFGAWQNYTYQCDYDPDTETVLFVRATPGKM